MTIIDSHPVIIAPIFSILKWCCFEEEGFVTARTVNRPPLQDPTAELAEILAAAHRQLLRTPRLL